LKPVVDELLAAARQQPANVDETSMGRHRWLWVMVTAGKRSRVDGDNCILPRLCLRRATPDRFGVHRQQTSPGRRSAVTALLSLRELLYSFQPFKQPTFRQVGQPRSWPGGAMRRSCPTH
jgi:hypothetical protein